MSDSGDGFSWCGFWIGLGLWLSASTFGTLLLEAAKVIAGRE